MNVRDVKDVCVCVRETESMVENGVEQSKVNGIRFNYPRSVKTVGRGVAMVYANQAIAYPRSADYIIPWQQQH